MSYEPGDDARALATVVRGFLEKHSPESAVRQWMGDDSSFDPHVWQLAAAEIGLQGLAIPEDLGGTGAGLVELGVLFEELGRAVYGGPMLASVGFAANAILNSSDATAQRDLLPGIASGESIAAVAWGGRDPRTSTIRADVARGGHTLTGAADYVLAGPQATLLLVLASGEDGVGLYAVEDTTAPVWTALMPLDQTRALAHAEFASTPARMITITPGGLDKAVDIWTLLLAAEQLGGAQRVLESAVEYASTRVQFGRVIGSFQAIKHRCADLLVEVESARSVVWHGLWTADHDPDNLGIAAALAGAFVSEAFLRVAAENIQIHGGIGFTWEHSAHLYIKRAKASALLLDSATRHRSRLGDLLGIAEGH